jgi:hypothetical protein
MTILPSLVPDSETDPQSLADVIQMPGVEVVDEQLDTVDPEDILAYRGPLDADAAGNYPTLLRGGVITDPEEIKAIRLRVEAGVAREARRGAWRRTLRRIYGGA